MRARAGGRPGRQHAVVIPALCASCGICTGACPSSTPFRSSERLVTGIDMPQQPIDAVRARLERALSQLTGERPVVLFGCDHGAAVAGCAGPDVAVFSLLCIGMLPPSFIEYALRHGADGVLIATCRRGECAYRLGNRWLDERLAGGREPRLRPSVARERVRLAEAGLGEEAALASALAAFRVALVGMRPNPPRRSSRKRSGLALTQQETG
jgi:coenzyme F420-reducing hydrogenase delta subunit